MYYLRLLLFIAVSFVSCAQEQELKEQEDNYRNQIIQADLNGVTAVPVVDTLLGNCDGSYRFDGTDWNDWDIEISDRRFALTVPRCGTCMHDYFISEYCLCREACERTHVDQTGIQFQQCLNRCGRGDLPAYTEWGVIVVAYRSTDQYPAHQRLIDYPNNLFEPYVNYGIRQAKTIKLYEGDTFVIDDRYLSSTLNELWTSGQEVCILIDLSLYRQREGTTETEACCNYRSFICNY